jgi:hypothetical protein
MPVCVHPNSYSQLLAKAMDPASVIAVVAAALGITKQAAEICVKYRHLDESIVALHRKADSLTETLDLVAIVLKTRRHHLETRWSQMGPQPFEEEEKQIWEKLRVLAENCKDAAEVFRRETRKLQPSDRLRSSVKQFWKMSTRESAFARYESDVDRYLSNIRTALACLSP